MTDQDRNTPAKIHFITDWDLEVGEGPIIQHMPLHNRIVVITKTHTEMTELQREIARRDDPEQTAADDVKTRTTLSELDGVIEMANALMLNSAAVDAVVD